MLWKDTDSRQSLQQQQQQQQQHKCSNVYNIAATVSTPDLLDLCLSAKHNSNQSCLYITTISTT